MEGGCLHCDFHPMGPSNPLKITQKANKMCIGPLFWGREVGCSNPLLKKKELWGEFLGHKNSRLDHQRVAGSLGHPQKESRIKESHFWEVEDWEAI